MDHRIPRDAVHYCCAKRNAAFYYILPQFTTKLRSCIVRGPMTRLSAQLDAWLKCRRQLRPPAPNCTEPSFEKRYYARARRPNDRGRKFGRGSTLTPHKKREVHRRNARFRSGATIGWSAKLGANQPLPRTRAGRPCPLASDVPDRAPSVKFRPLDSPAVLDLPSQRRRHDLARRPRLAGARPVRLAVEKIVSDNRNTRYPSLSIEFHLIPPNDCIRSLPSHHRPARSRPRP